ncbi:hypothetical protein LshimejAT787_1901470 [Lyophyllum shimeji]|uniref:Uncharacterized protein n=1 Tax=Lyophyllum shimeji TaxID=47721 RepID=A0A9P3URH0_LYOSH|nr:hypothetical protein LshimejAT787_1901470 [Lyophyllum shimeji]
MMADSNGWLVRFLSPSTSIQHRRESGTPGSSSLSLTTTDTLGMTVLVHSRATPNSALIQQWQDASWIWLSDGTNPNVPGGDWAFRTTYAPPSSLTAVSANILITADDYFTLYINGQQIGGTRTPANDGKTVWASAVGYSVTLNANRGSPAVFGVLVTNNANSAAGLLVAIQLTLSDGSSATMSTGRTGWRATGSIPQNFEQPGTDDSGWQTPVVIEKNAGSAPWGVVQLPGDMTGVTLNSAAPQTPANTGGGAASTSNGAGGPSATGSPQGTSQVAGGGVATTVLITTGADGSTITSTRTSTISQSSSTSTITAGAGAANAGTGTHSKTPVGVIAGATVGGVVFLMLLLALLLLLLKRRRAATPVSLAAPDHERSTFLTAATGAPSPGFLSPSSGLSSPDPTGRIEPFVLQSQQDDGLRSNTHYEKSGTIWGNLSDHHDRSPSLSSSSVPPQMMQMTGGLGVTMDRLHELAEELNRGLAERGGPNTPRLMVVAADSTSGSVYHGRHESVALPPYEGRPEDS